MVPDPLCVVNRWARILSDASDGDCIVFSNARKLLLKLSPVSVLGSEEGDNSAAAVQKSAKPLHELGEI